MTKPIILITLILTGVILAGGCEPNARSSDKKRTPPSHTPVFNADSAYHYIETQVKFGARVPGSDAHAACADYLKNTLERFGATAEFQHDKGTLYNGESIAIKNIIGKFNPSAVQRILLCAHWDSRPFADYDADEAKRQTPVLGANDGASGVGVLLEVARHLDELPENLGLDIVFFDVEDYGAPQFYTGRHIADAWCIGSQAWAQRAKKERYQAQYGILLDMVGARGARFFKEQVSLRYAPQVVERIWEIAQNLGFDNYFVPEQGSAITDDHLFINQLAGIPCIDIIQQLPTSSTGFGDYWHTTHDDMHNIDRNTLYAVGQTVLCGLNN
ncbi:MAG: M28 family peptidase [Prevotellaceae bacterium]|jgi:Zn-dependent M28 family amino/carboxypeptidase|nr:M28 family peptidase [Prevotellaceae bacterium]